MSVDKLPYALSAACCFAEVSFGLRRWRIAVGIYVTARKIEENEEYVVYACGNSPERLYTAFKIDKAALEYGLTDPQSHIAVKDLVTVLYTDHKCCWIAILGKILSYHKDNNTFPDKMSKES